MFYITVILATLVITGLCHVPFGDAFSWTLLGKALGNAALGVIAVIAIDGVVAFVIRRLPERWFSPENKIFRVSKREREILRKTKIGKWKRVVPELGCFTGFHKDHVADPSSVCYLGRFLMESNYGVLGHVLGALLGFLILLLPCCQPLSAGLPIAIVNFILSMLPTLILRYNTPSLLRLYERAKRNEEGKMNE